MTRSARAWVSHEGRILLMALAAGLPGSLVALILLWTGDFTPKVQWTLTVAIATLWLGFAFAVRERVVFPLQTLSNLLSALREGDFSVRGRSPRADDALGEVMREVNTLSSTLREQRLGAMEATTLVRAVMREVDVAIFAFDDQGRLRLLNIAGERLLGQPAERLIGARAEDLRLRDCLDGQPQQVFQAVFPGVGGRLWSMRRSTVREHGLPLHLLVVSDVTQALREQELEAWQRLVRVLGHELNNSLTPIKSIAASLASLLSRELGEDWQDDMRRGLAVISSRSDSLGRFIGAYARLAKLPRPQMQALELAGCVQRVVGMETRVRVGIRPGPEVMVRADPDQLEQVLINLLRNAADAALETSGGVRLGWSRNGSTIEIWVEDDGPGLSNTANLFVPFFTTKPGGSGIGLVLCRQIVEAHGGGLTLENRAGARGCIARLRLPV